MGDSEFYQITSSGLKTVSEDEFWEQSDTIAVIDADKLKNSQTFGQFCSSCTECAYVRGSRIVRGEDYILIEWQVPEKTKKNGSWRYTIFVKSSKIICIQYETTQGKVQKLISACDYKFVKEQAEDYTKERFLYGLFSAMTADDLQYMEKLERTLAVLEEEVFYTGGMDFNNSMLQVKKKIFQFYRYYSQFIEIAAALEENENAVLDAQHTAYFSRIKEKAQRLATETQVLREYAVQVQEVYQSELGIRQNHIMKILTAVTTVCLPLNLIAGWYGMNFSYMPELSWEYGYPMAAGISALVLVLLLWLFRRKGFW